MIVTGILWFVVEVDGCGMGTRSGQSSSESIDGGLFSENTLMGGAQPHLMIMIK